MRLLADARLGLLDRDWRANIDALLYDDDSPFETARRPSEPSLIDACELVIHAAVTAPVADWEPYATGGDWRWALHAWYTAETDRLVNYQRRENEAFVASIGLPPLDNSGLSPSIVRQLDYAEARYRGPLAAGGTDDDWLGWFRGRIETWPENGGWDGRTAWLARLRDDPEFVHSMESVPVYWSTVNTPAGVRWVK